MTSESEDECDDAWEQGGYVPCPYPHHPLDVEE